VSTFFAAIVRTSAGIAHRARKTLDCQTESHPSSREGGSPVSTLAIHRLASLSPPCMHAHPRAVALCTCMRACMARHGGHMRTAWVGRCTSHLCCWRSVLVSRPVATSSLCLLGSNQPALSSPLVARVCIVSACSLVAWLDIVCSNECQFRHCDSGGGPACEART
jgi:hypothetical protein